MVACPFMSGVRGADRAEADFSAGGPSRKAERGALLALKFESGAGQTRWGSSDSIFGFCPRRSWSACLIRSQWGSVRGKKWVGELTLRGSPPTSRVVAA